MATGIIYVMTTAVDGLVKIGKTGLNNFEDRMYELERNGYSNVTALKRRFAIEVEDYDDKEKLLYDIFSNSKISNTELYALDVDLVIQLLTSFEGKKIYPYEKTKEQIFDDTTKERESKKVNNVIPDGEYYFSKMVMGFGKTDGRARVENGIFTVLRGSICSAITSEKAPEVRKTARIKDDILQEDIKCNSPSIAAAIICGRNVNGWEYWKDKNGDPITIYRNKNI